MSDFLPIICQPVEVSPAKTIMQAVQVIINPLVLIDEDRLDLAEKNLGQLNASSINQSEMNPLWNDVNLKSGTVLYPKITDINNRTLLPYDMAHLHQCLEPVKGRQNFQRILFHPHTEIQIDRPNI